MNDDLKLAYDTITGKYHDQNDAWQYYLGDQPLVYANERLREIFSGVQVRFIENWCSVVVDSLKERIQLLGFQVGGEEDEQQEVTEEQPGVEVINPAQDAIDRIWELNDLNLESDDLHECALVTGEAYLIIWPGEDGAPEIYYNDSRMVQAFYRSDNPRAMRFAAKMWTDDDGKGRITLYYPDHLEYYVTDNKADSVSSVAAFKPAEPPDAPNPYGQIPVFHFRARRQNIGEIYDVIPVQNGINKLLTDMMVAAEYGAFRQRWVISNSDMNILRNAPNEIWNIPAGDGIGQSTSVGEFSPTDLGNYLKSVEQLAGDIGKITRTPRHYFGDQGGDPSGEALIAMEAPLNKKAQNRIERFTSAWKAAMQFALMIEGKSVAQADIELVWAPVETVQPRTQAEIRVLEGQAGIPLKTSLRREGWSDSEIEDMEADKQGTTAALGEQLLTAFDKGDEELDSGATI